MPTAISSHHQPTGAIVVSLPVIMSEQALKELIMEEWGVSIDYAAIIYDLLNRAARRATYDTVKVAAHLVEWVGQELCHILYDDGYEPEAPSLLYYLNQHFSRRYEWPVWLSAEFDESLWPGFGSLFLHNVRLVEPRA